jgi:hypothetical protein
MVLGPSKVIEFVPFSGLRCGCARLWSGIQHTYSDNLQGEEDKLVATPRTDPLAPLTVPIPVSRNQSSSASESFAT